jgi:hypothetical protein
MPSSFGGKSRKGNKRGKSSRKGARKSRKGRRRTSRRGTSIAGGFTMSAAKNALAVLGGAATAATLESKFQGKYEPATGRPRPLGLIGAAATLIAGQTKALSSYRHLLQNAAIGMVVPAGLSFARSSNLIPSTTAAGYEAGYIDVGDVDGMDVDGMDSEGLIHIGNVDVGGDDVDKDEKRAARIQAKIFKARAKGKDKRVARLEGRLKKKGLEEEAQELLREAVDDDDAPAVVVRRGPAAPVLVPRRRPLAPVRALPPRFRGGRGR